MAATLKEWLRHHPQPAMLRMITHPPKADGTVGDYEVRPYTNLKEYGRDLLEMLRGAYIGQPGEPFATNDATTDDEPENTLQIALSATLAGQIVTTLEKLLGERIETDVSEQTAPGHAGDPGLPPSDPGPGEGS